MGKDYIPAADAEFNNFFRHITRYVAEKCTGRPPEWTHIPAEELNTLNDAYTAWYSAYELTLVPHPQQLTRAKNEQRAISEKVLRQFVQDFLHYKAVTNLDRDKMKLPNRSRKRSRQGEVTECMAVTTPLRNHREVVFKYRVMGSTRRGKPDGYHAIIRWAILDKPPESHNDLHNTVVSTSSPHILTFGEEDRGKIVYYSLCWQNRAGVMGPWSDIGSTRVP
ncbi:MAG: hypothetical protein FWB99_04250 [Treponema sp.]|nr:hypothetical protein [Treponema sp.]